MGCPGSVYQRWPARRSALAVMRKRAAQQSLKPTGFTGRLGSGVEHQRHG